jgi:hypothetical protein
MELHMNPFKGRHFQRDIILGRTLVLQIVGSGFAAK